MIPIAQPLLGEAEHRAVREVLESGILAAGPRVARFEQAFAAAHGLPHGIATANGTVALHAALLAAGVKPGDGVITTPFTFVATLNAILYCGARPLLADIDPGTFNLSPATVRDCLRRHPEARAILCVHLFGLPCPMAELAAVADEHGLILIEDAAQAHGATYRGRPVGGFGAAGVFSFYATKNMTTGEGGMIVTASPEIARRARSLVNHGRMSHYEYGEIGYNYRMTEIAAALGLVQLGRLPAFNEARRRNAALLDQGLAGLGWLKTPAVPAGCGHVYHQYTVRAESRDRLQAWLAQEGVSSAVIYPLPLHRQPAFRHLDFGGHPLPEAEAAAATVLSLPVHPGLSAEDLERIVAAVRRFPAGPEKSAGERGERSLARPQGR